MSGTRYVPSESEPDTTGELSEENVRAVVEFAALAPSVHNTQPWRFVARGSTIEMCADDDRRLTYLDPNGRQQAISCGAAVEYARLAIRALGWSCVVRLLPGGPTVSGPLATLTVGRPEPITAEEQRLVDAVPRRRTDRGPYDDIPIGQAVLRRARYLVASRGGWLRALDRPGERTIAAYLLVVAEGIESNDPAYTDEITAWRRTARSTDGVPVGATPDWDPTVRVSDLPLRDFTGRGRHPHSGGQEPPPLVEHDAVILVGSDDDSPLAWLRTGAAVGLLWLALTDAGVSAEPLGPVTDVPATRSRLRMHLGLLGQPQLMFRIGHGTAGLATGRRSVEDMLEVASST